MVYYLKVTQMEPWKQQVILNPRTAFWGLFVPQTMLTVDKLRIHALEVHDSFGVQMDPRMQVTLVF